jgi:membrane protein
VLGVGFLLLVSLILSSVLSALGGQLSDALPAYNILWQLLEVVVSFLVITLLFAALYKFIPDVEISWRDVWIGALVTSVLFSIGRFALGLYLGNSSTTSVYGAAGSLVVVLLWVFYSAQILFFGAEFTQVYANRFGSQIVPSKNAVAVGKWDPGAAARQAVDTEARPTPGKGHAGQAEPSPAQARAGSPRPAEVARATPLSILVPFSFAVGLLLGAYRRIRG